MEGPGPSFRRSLKPTFDFDLWCRGLLSGVIRFLRIRLITHRNVCAEIGDCRDNVPAELRDGLHLADIKYVRAMLASVEFVEILQIVFD